MAQTRFTDGTDKTDEHPVTGEYKVARDKYDNKYNPGAVSQMKNDPPSEPNDVVRGMEKYNLKKMHDAGMNADPEHQELKRHLGVYDDDDIPDDQMQAAMGGQHGPQVQQLAHSVHQKLQDSRATDMNDVFAGSRGKDNSKKPMPAQPQGPPQAAPRNSRYDME